MSDTPPVPRGESDPLLAHSTDTQADRERPVTGWRLYVLTALWTVVFIASLSLLVVALVVAVTGADAPGFGWALTGVVVALILVTMFIDHKARQ